MDLLGLSRLSHCLALVLTASAAGHIVGSGGEGLVRVRVFITEVTVVDT